MMFRGIIESSFSCLMWGVLIAFLCTSIFAFILKGWRRDATFSVWTYLIGGMLFILMAFQCTMMVGSIKLINTADEYETYFSEIINNLDKVSEQIPDKDVGEVIELIKSEYPIVENYIDVEEFTDLNVRQLPGALAEKIRSFLRAYIIHRLLWCLGFVLIAGILGIKTLDKHYATSAKRGLSERRHSSGSRSVPNGSHRPRINTHRRR